VSLELTSDQNREMEQRCFSLLSSHLFMSNVIFCDIPQTLELFSELFDRTKRLWDTLPQFIRQRWFVFLRLLLPSIKKFTLIIDDEYDRDRKNLVCSHPEKAALLAALDTPRFLVASSWSSDEKAFFRNWKRNLQRRIMRSYRRIYEPAIASAWRVFENDNLHPTESAKNRHVVFQAVIRMSKEISLCRMSFPESSKDHFFDLLDITFKFFDYRSFVSASLSCAQSKVCDA